MEDLADDICCGGFVGLISLLLFRASSTSTLLICFLISGRFIGPCSVSLPELSLGDAPALPLGDGSSSGSNVIDPRRDID